MIEELIHAGMNVARLNFSHGSLADHEKNIKNIREISTRLKKTIAIIQDLSGQKIRVGALSKGTVILKANDPFTLTTAVVEGAKALPRLPTPTCRIRSLPGIPFFSAMGKSN